MKKLNKDWKRRDEILGIRVDWDKSSGVERFGPLTLQELQMLAYHDFLDVEDYQNSGPSIKRIMEEMANYEDIQAYGYAVSPRRPDYRVTIDEVRISGELGERLIAKYAPDPDFTDQLVEMIETADEKDEHHGKFRLWWD